ERVGPARKDERVGAAKVRGERISDLGPGEHRIRVPSLQRRALRAVADDDLRSWQIQAKKRFDVLLDRDAADAHEYGAPPVVFDPGTGAEQVRIDSPRPADEVLEAS